MKPHLRVIAGRPVCVAPPPPSQPRRRLPERDLEFVLPVAFLASGILMGWLLFEALRYLPW